ncbi:DNA primase [Coprobacter fastidiosus]|jgi:DNA primase|uniref:DNA primase n=1 Tax=Coprobacter fastidiosus NSB1 = JCM 33896 TaxID=1349822 RepID=A0A495VJJ8_9BACT|nr:DNA primase [Coprobacter fastidiosus]ERM88823.1 DNA primase [Coprobacter fastidiosus NSB1 = JCM 33896]RHS49285.1 DNA primase [Tannerella sp. AF04-6]RKT49539.1 DNA primase [Coprobacter fastidiosus NSB1 = JCM 33896]BEG61722.1 DNA primase [Coprobacter fastidiosus]
MIDQATVDKIIDSANILEVVSDFVTLRKRGVNYVGLCPFHDEKTPSFSVSPSKGICKCFSCGKGGSAVHFIMEHEQLSYYEALKYLAKKYNIEIEERELSDEEKQIKSDRESMLIVNSFAQEYFSNILFQHSEGRSVGLAYFHERGFRDDIIHKFALGYSLEQRDALAIEAKKRGYKEEYLLKTGLCLEGQNGYISDRFRGRVIFPVFSLSGKVLAFGGRVLRKSDKLAKYVNSPESEVYHKSNVLYGIYQAKQSIVKNDNCFLVEGYTDVLSMHQAGVENVVASSGTSLTPGQIRLIHRFTNNITVIYDGDAAGIKASLRGIDLILKEGMNIKVVLLPDGDDPDSFAKKQSASSFTEYIKNHEVDFIRFKTNLLLDSAGNDPIKRAELISDIVQSIAIIPDTIVRSVYTKECSRLMEISEEVLLREINKIKLSQLQNGTPPNKKTLSETSADKQNSQEEGTQNDDTETLMETQGVPQGVLQEKRVPSPLDPFEKTLVRYMIRYGFHDLFSEINEETGETETWKVIPYILTDLRNDEIEFQHPLYKKVIAEINHIFDQEGEHLTRYFLAHPDEEISRLAVDLVSEKYQLSKIHTKFQTIESEEEKLADLIPRALFELKDAITSLNIKHIREEIKKTAKEKNPERTTQLMSELNGLYALKAALAKQLGERIVSPK